MMQSRPSMFVRLSPLALLTILSAAACGSTVSGSDDGDDGPGDCGEAPPLGMIKDCPQTWVCIDGEWMDTAGACPDPCPPSQPADGETCPYPGTSCDYDDEFDCGGGGTVTSTCTEEGWVSMTLFCQPEPECPDELPLNGAGCDGWDFAYYCAYDVETSCGIVQASASCDFVEAGPTWSVQLLDGCPSCDAHFTAETCDANPACQWLEPGCGDPALAIAGCFPAEPCTADSCDEGETCIGVVIDPCWKTLCNACGEERDVCEPVEG